MYYLEFNFPRHLPVNHLALQNGLLEIFSLALKLAILQLPNAEFLGTGDQISGYTLFLAYICRVFPWIIPWPLNYIMYNTRYWLAWLLFHQVERSTEGKRSFSVKVKVNIRLRRFFFGQWITSIFHNFCQRPLFLKWVIKLKTI